MPLMHSGTDLGSLLRGWRSRSHASVSTQPRAGTRRSIGLRREELAALAGVSVDYIVRLEQGRSSRPSKQVVDALVRALRLDEVEQQQLHIAAGLPTPLPVRMPTEVPDSVLRLLSRWPDLPFAVYTTAWTMLTASSCWVALLGRLNGEQNLVLQEFLGGGVPVEQGVEEREQYKRSLVSDLRTAALRYPADPVLGRIIDRLLAESSTFGEMWVEGRSSEFHSRRKTFIVESVGRITLDCDVLSVSGTDLRVVTYTATPGTKDADRLERVRSSFSTPAADVFAREMRDRSPSRG